MGTSPEARAEAVYLDIYGIAAGSADLLQPPAGVDFLLAEAFVAALAGNIVVAIIQGAFGELGKGLVEHLRKRPFRQSELVTAKPEFLIAELSRRMADGTLPEARLASARTKVEQSLRELGMADDMSRKLADEIHAAFSRRQNEH